jgi:hypothetical protein
LSYVLIPVNINESKCVKYYMSTIFWTTTILHSINFVSLHGQIRLCKGIQKRVTLCCNPHIGFATKCKVQRPMRSRMCLSVKHTLSQMGGWGGGMQGMKPNDSKCTPILGVVNVQSLGGRKQEHQIRLLGYH